MGKDLYSGSGRVRGGRIESPSYRNLPASPEPVPRDADDALSGELMRLGSFNRPLPTRRGQGSTSQGDRIRSNVRSNLARLHQAVIRAGESPRDAMNAIRARLGQRMVPQSFTTRKPFNGRTNSGAVPPGSQARVTRVRAGENGEQIWTVAAVTPGGRQVSNDFNESQISGMF